MTGIAGCVGLRASGPPSCGSAASSTSSRPSGPFGFTEGPVWDGIGVLFSDIGRNRIIRYDAETGECTVYRENTDRANGLKMIAAGDLFACEMGGRRVPRYDDERLLGAPGSD